MLAVLAAHGWAVDMHVVERRSFVGALAHASLAAGANSVIIAGGDGSVHEAVQALAGSPVALGVLPCGTANVWAQELGLPRWRSGWLAQAARILAESEVRAVDLGRANGRHFLLWAGIGLDAHITARVNPGWLKRTFGAPGYILDTLISAARFRSVWARLLLAIVSNVQLYAGGVVRLDARARLDDGLLEAWAFRGEGLGSALAHLLRVRRGRHWGAPGVWHGRIRRIIVETEPPALVHLDGDPLLRTPVEIEVAPGALRALIPRRGA